MKDLKIYYQNSSPGSTTPTINSDFDKEIEKLAKEHGLYFMGSGVEIGTGVRDLHYRRKDEKRKS